MPFENYRFLNGGRAAGYVGVPVNSGRQILDLIAQTLGDAGWVINDQIVSSNYFIAGATRSGTNYNTWVKFTDNLTGGIQLCGDFYGTNLTLSPVAQTISYSPGEEARLYISCREDSGAITLLRLNASPNPFSTGAFFGFVVPELPTDGFCAYVGPNTPNGVGECYVMRHFTTNQIWVKPSLDLSGSGVIPTPPTTLVTNGAYYFGGLDYLMLSGGILGNGFAYNPIHGMVNGLNNLPDALPMFLMEGYGNTNYFGFTFLKDNKSCNRPFLRRGHHPFVISGFNNIAPGRTGEKVSASGTTRVYLSGGVGTNGMLIHIF